MLIWLKATIQHHLHDAAVVCQGSSYIVRDHRNQPVQHFHCIGQILVLEHKLFGCSVNGFVSLLQLKVLLLVELGLLADLVSIILSLSDGNAVFVKLLHVVFLKIVQLLIVLSGCLKISRC